MEHLTQKRYPSENLQKISEDDYYDIDSWVQAYNTVLNEGNRRIDGEDGTNYLRRAKNCLNMAITGRFYSILYKHCK